MSLTGPTKIIIVDDHDLVRRGLLLSLEGFDEVEVLAEASDGASAVALCEQLQPHVVLMDLVMPEMDGVAATKLVLGRCPDTRIVALTSFEDKDLVRDALDAGVISYVLKNVTMQELVSVIRKAHQGIATMSREVK